MAPPNARAARPPRDAGIPFAPGLLARLPGRPRMVALLRASRVGDFVCATPAFRALRAALPGSEITLIGLPLVRELALRSPSIDRFVAFPGLPGIAEQLFDAARCTRFFAAMRAERFDLAVQMHGSGVYSNPACLRLGALATAGFVRPGDPPGGLDAAMPFPYGRHEVHRLLALAEFLGAPPRGTHTELSLWPEDRAAAAALLADARAPLIGLAPGARDAVKRWAPERFAEAGARLRATFGGTVVVLGGPGEEALVGMVARRAGRPGLALAGGVRLPVLGAVVERLALLVTNDSGPAHIARALGTPTVTVFGGTDPAEWGPLPGAGIHRALAHAVPCRPCGHASCPIGDACLGAVTVAPVAEAASGVLRDQGISPVPERG